MDAAARVHRTAFDAALPWLAGLHTPDQDRWFYRERMFSSCALWGAFAESGMIGVIAFRKDWIDQLYVDPDLTGRGIGAQLLDLAKRERPQGLRLWTFVSNDGAQRFYERHGFSEAERTDGARNEERAPDIRYVWTGSLPPG